MNLIVNAIEEEDFVPKQPPVTQTPEQHGNLFDVRDSGVYFMGVEDEPLFICSKLEVTAVTRDDQNTGYGRLLEWRDTDGHLHKWAMPMKMTAGDGLALREILLDRGLTISSSRNAKRLIIDYIAQREVTAFAKCVEKTGWYGGSFVLPDAVLGGEGAEQVILQTTTGVNNHFRVVGTLQEWRDHVSHYCIGNSRLAFAVSVAFAAPLLHPINMDGGGFNLKGHSSEGKTTALKVATSVCGGPDFMQTWRTTDNGLEGIAANHNDALLPIDEMGQVDPRKAGEIAYMLANGMGKQRAQRTGVARPKRGWRVLFLSTGEISLADHLRGIGLRVKAGQEVRLADIPMNTGMHGGFEQLHGFKDGAEFSDHLSTQSRLYHGAPFSAYIEHIVTKPDEITRWVKEAQQNFINAVVPPGASGQVKRVAARFGLVAAGGSLATMAGITGWPTGEAVKAAEICFKAWLAERGGAGNKEDQQALDQVISFFQLHGESRFSQWDAEGSTKTINRAGYLRYKGGETFYYVYPTIFRTEICKGFDAKRVADLCIDRGWLKPGPEGRRTQVQKLPDSTTSKRVYVFTSSVMGGSGDNE